MFSISERAVAFIVAQRQALGVGDAVAMLQYDLGDLKADGEVARALREGLDLATVTREYQREFEVDTSSRRQLVVAFLPRAEMPQSDLVQASGIEFCLPARLAEFLSPYLLDLDAHGQLCFLDSRGKMFEY